MNDSVTQKYHLDARLENSSIVSGFSTSFKVGGESDGIGGEGADISHFIYMISVILLPMKAANLFQVCGDIRRLLPLV